MTAYEAACNILSAMVAAFDAAGRPFSRSYVSDGSVLFDFDECLVVEWSASDAAGFSGPYGLQVADMKMGILPLEATFDVHAGRYTIWPDEAGTPPLPAEIQVNAELVHCDAQVILETLLAGIRDDSLFGMCNYAIFRGQRSFGPDGGIVGSVTRFTVSL